MNLINKDKLWKQHESCENCTPPENLCEPAVHCLPSKYFPWWFMTENIALNSVVKIVKIYTTMEKKQAGMCLA